MRRESNNVISNMLDNWIPPVIRDSKILMIPLLKLATRSTKYKLYMEFKDKVPFLTEEEINEYYRVLNETFLSRPTDCNEKCIRRIIGGVVGISVLDVASGRGYLIQKIKKFHPAVKCTGCDIIQPEGLESGIEWIEGSITHLPFKDNSFDTVVSTHTLEHIKDLEKAVEEIRRVCKKKLIIVVPRQREYKYTFNLHINFFPYIHDIRRLLGKDAKIELLDGDWYCEIEL